MKRKLTALLLSAAMITSMIPTVSAASGTPNEFYQQVGLELLPARSEGLYDEPAHPKPDADGSGFIREIDGWTPAPVTAGLPVAVQDPDAGATEIATAEDLQGIQNPGSYVLTEDIDLTGVAWTPKDIPGALTLDGQGHTVKGLKLSPTEPKSFGLFASVDGTFTVENLRLDGAQMDMGITRNGSFSYHVGTLVGYARTTILHNVVADVTVTRTWNASPYIGGIIGEANGALTVSDCAFTVAIGDAEGLEASGGGRIAGIAGSAGTTVLERIYADVSIDGTKAPGCVIGGLFPRVVPTVRDSRIEVEMKGENNALGGILAWGSSGTLILDNCVVNAAMIGSGELGGIAGKFSQGVFPELTDCRITADLTATGKTYGGGLAGTVENCGSEIKGCAVDFVIRSEGVDRNTSDVVIDAGGMYGHATRGDMNVTGCDIRANFDELVGGSGSIGGLAGYLGWFDFKDTFVDLSANGTTQRTDMNIGGLAGFSDWSGTVQNCGAKVDIAPAYVQGCPTGAAGLIGYAREGVAVARSYASGRIKLDTTGLETYSGSLLAGGLTTNTASGVIQCYGGVDIDVKWQGGHAADLGGIALNANVLVSTWSDAAISSDHTEDARRGSLGGLVTGSNTVQDCCFVGKIPVSDATSVAGISAGGIGTMRNCYATADIPGADNAGGLLGATTYTGSYNCYDCWYKGTVRGSTTAGGIAGNAGGGKFFRCDASGTVSAPGGTAGGVAAVAGNMEDCSYNGTVGGASVGGVVGNVTNIYRSTFRGNVKIELEEAVYTDAGGIAAGSSWIEDCHVLNPLSVSITKKEIGTTYQQVGGIGGRWTGTVLNCTTKGVAVHSDREVEGYHIYLGGVAPGYESRVMAENCKINGSVTYSGDTATVCMGGIIGFGKNDGFGKPKATLKNCVVNGAVSARTNPSTPGGYEIITIGGLVGDARETILDGSHHNGAVSASSSDPTVGIIRKDELVGTGDYVKENVPGATKTTRDGESYTVRTFWHDQSGLSMFPLSGATVYLGETAVGTTGQDGSLTLSGEDVSNRKMVKVSAEHPNYFGSSTVDFLCAGGSVDLILRKKEAGKIYLTSALIETGDGEMQEMLYSKNSVRIMLNEQAPQHYFFGVDWNDTQTVGRKLVLMDKNGNIRYNLTAGVDMYFRLPEIFDPDEEIYLKAFGLKQDGTETSMQVLLPLKVKMFTPKISMTSEEIPMGDHDGKRGIDALAGIKLGLDFSNLFDGVAKLTYANHVLTAEFGGKPFESPESKLLGTQVKTGIKGVLSLTDEDKNTPIGDRQWSGGVHLFLDLDPALSYAPVSVPGKPPFPFTFYTELKAGGDFGVDVYGTLNKPRIGGALTVNFDANITAGLGGSANRDWLLVVGGRLGGEGKYTGSVSVGQEDLTKDGYGEVALYVDVAIVGKGGELGKMMELDAAYQIGRIQWDSKNGATVYALGNDVSQLSDQAVWTPSTQAYLTAGGGFITAPLRNPAALYSWNGTPITDQKQANVAQLYENIVQGSSAALTVENGNLVLWFTADDGDRELEGNVADHTAVWRSVQDEDGSWSDPVIVSGSENGYPDRICADGPAAVWVESTQTGSLEELLTSTRIKVAVNGEVFHTIETGGYTYNAKVSAADDGSNILISWLSAPEVNGLETVMSAQPALCYARYADGVWSQGTVPTGEKIPVDATPIYGEPIIAWTDTAGQQYRNARTDFTYNAVWIADLARAEHNGNFTAEMEEDGTLVIWEGTAQKASLQTGSAGFEAPLLLDDGNGVCYAVWTEQDGIYYADSASGWAYAKPVCELEQQVFGLSGTVENGLPVVTWYQADNNEDNTDYIYHLYTAQAPDLSGADLSVNEVTLDEEGVGDSGLIMVSAEVVNRGEGVVTGYTYTVTDETGKEHFTGTISDVSLGYEDTDLCHALIAVDVDAQHTYTVTLTAAEDSNSANNAGAVTAQSRPKLSAASFQLMSNGEIGLKAVAGNAGSAPLAEMTMEIYRCNSDGTLMGDVLAAESFETVRSGSYRQLMLNEAVMDTLYKVVLTCGGEEVDSEMLMWSEPEASGAWITGVELSEEGVAKVKLSAQNWTETLMLHLAVYDENGRMAANTMENLESWTGAKTLEYDFSEELTGGKYTCSAFLLKRDGLMPVVEKVTDTVVIP